MLYKIIAVNKDGSTYKHEEIVESDSEYSALQSMLYQNKLYHNLDLSNCELTATPVQLNQSHSLIIVNMIPINVGMEGLIHFRVNI